MVGRCDKEVVGWMVERCGERVVVWSFEGERCRLGEGRCLWEGGGQAYLVRPAWGVGGW
jgi:hypothetical protein